MKPSSCLCTLRTLAKVSYPIRRTPGCGTRRTLAPERWHAVSTHCGRSSTNQRHEDFGRWSNQASGAKRSPSRTSLPKHTYQQRVVHITKTVGLRCPCAGATPEGGLKAQCGRRFAVRKIFPTRPCGNCDLGCHGQAETGHLGQVGPFTPSKSSCSILPSENSKALLSINEPQVPSTRRQTPSYLHVLRRQSLWTVGACWPSP